MEISFSFVSKEIDRKFRAVVNQVVDDREKNGTRRDDLLQVILDLRKKYGKTEFTENDIVGHSMTFLVCLLIVEIPTFANSSHPRLKATKPAARQCLTLSMNLH